MANTKEPQNLTPFLSLVMFQHYRKDYKLTQSEWDAACDMLNGKGNYPVDEMIKNVIGCVEEHRELKASKKADAAERKAERESKKLGKEK